MFNDIRSFCTLTVDILHYDSDALSDQQKLKHVCIDREVYNSD